MLLSSGFMLDLFRNSETLQKHSVKVNFILFSLENNTNNMETMHFAHTQKIVSGFSPMSVIL